MGTQSRLLVGSLITTVRRTLRLKRPHLLVACMPKSASTFLTDALAALPGMRRAPVTWACGWREHVLDEIQLARYDLRSWVSQVHLRYSDHVGQAIEDYHLTPIVMTRNIFDAVASLRDHIRKEPTVFPMITLAPEHAKLPDEDLEELIAELAIPWYINFYVTWHGIDCIRVLLRRCPGKAVRCGPQYLRQVSLGSRQRQQRH